MCQTQGNGNIKRVSWMKLWQPLGTPGKHVKAFRTLSGQSKIYSRKFGRYSETLSGKFRNLLKLNKHLVSWSPGLISMLLVYRALSGKTSRTHSRKSGKYSGNFRKYSGMLRWSTRDSSETVSRQSGKFPEGLDRFLDSLKNLPEHCLEKSSEPMSGGPWISEEFWQSANIGWPMSDEGFSTIRWPINHESDGWTLCAGTWLCWRAMQSQNLLELDPWDKG